MSFFSVIIPAYNRMPMLREALASVWQQTFTDYEVIVVDDGSTDGTAEAVEAAFRRWKSEQVGKLEGEPNKVPDFKVIRQENAGPGAARNTGAAHATGEYLAFLDSDDVWMPWTLQVYRDAIAFGEGASFVSGHGQPKGAPLCSESKPKFRRFGCMLEACSGTILPVGGTPSVAIKRTSFEKAGGFPGGRINGEDMDLWFRLGAEPRFVQIENPIVFQQGYHAKNISADMRSATDGVKYLFAQEHRGAYPGGKRYRKQRTNILAAFARTTSLQCLDAGETRRAWELFRISFPEHLRQAKLKYLLAFLPLLMIKTARRSRTHTARL